MGPATAYRCNMSDALETFSTHLPITTERLAIRILTADDARDLSIMTNDTRITGVVHFLPDDFTPEEAEKLIVGDQTGRDNFLGAWLKDSGEMAALIGVHFHDSGETEIGYWVNAELHGRGIATEAASAILATLKSCLPERRIIAECRLANTASWRLLEKLGFKGTGQDGERPGRMRLVLN